MLIKSLIMLAWRSLCFRRNAVLITVLSIAVSTFTLFSVEHLRQAVKLGFTHSVSGVDLIVGPRTSDINLLLTTVFRIGQASQNMSWKSYKDLSGHPNVAWAIPISLGDSHKGFRVVGTQQQFFSHFKYGQSRALVFASGFAFEKASDVVVGASVARELEYTLGQKLIIAHGMGRTSFQRHDAFPFRISGILKPTGTPVDNALYVSLAGLEAVHQPAAGYTPQRDKNTLEPKGISAAMLGLNSKFSTFKVQREVNTSSSEPLTAILPGVTLMQLWQISQGVENVLNLMAQLILFASLLGMGAVIMTALRERAYEFSVLRTLGARPSLIFILIQAEALLISIMGIVLGGVMFILMVLIIGHDVAANYGLDISINQISSDHGYTVLSIITAATIVGCVPALTGYLQNRNT